MSFAPGIRLELRQQQSLVLTPQLQQAIRLLQMSNVELRGAIDQEVAENPFLQRRDARGPHAAGRTGAGRWRRCRDMPASAPPARRPLRPADCALALKSPAGRTFDDDRPRSRTG